jgi:hypothetical protein
MDLKVRLKDDSVDIWKRLKSDTGLDDAGLLTHALTLLNACVYENRRGHRICVVDEDADILKELILNLDNKQ